MDEAPKTMPAAGHDAPAHPRKVAAAVDEPESSRDHPIVPVWFFVGIILLVDGVLIFATGLSELNAPPTTVLGHLHPAIWWGALLAVIGGIYVYLYFPRKSSP